MDLNSGSVVHKTNALDHWATMMYKKVERYKYFPRIFKSHILWRSLINCRILGVKSHLKMKINSLPLTFDMTWNSIENIYSLEAFTVPSWATFQQRSQEILSWQHFFNDQQFDLDLWPYDLKMDKGHLLSQSNLCTKFYNFQLKESKDVEQTSFIKRPAVDLWPWDLKIIRGYLLSRSIHCTKCGIFQAKRSKDHEWTSLGLQTDQPTDRCKTICPLFSKGGIKTNALN